AARTAAGRRRPDADPRRRVRGARVRVYRPRMSPRRVIGIDTGGTKLLGGVVDEALAVRDRVHRLWRGGGRREVLDLIVDAVAEREPESALGKELRAGREITGALVTELAHDGDETAREVLSLIGERLGVGITSIVNAFNPEVVVVGGGAIAAGELLLEPARRV